MGTAAYSYLCSGARPGDREAAACLLPPPLPEGKALTKKPLKILRILQRGPCCMEN